MCHQEKFGLGRQQPGVDLYSRKVLIEPGTKVMPEWLRFLHGTVLEVVLVAGAETAALMRLLFTPLCPLG